jgi:hypothetical protein
MAQDIGLLLRGLGASFANQVPQFRQQMAQEQENEMRQQEFQAQQAQRAQQGQMQDFEMMQARQQASFQDADAALRLAAAGNYEAIIALAEDRMELDQRFGGPLKGDNTSMLANMARRAAMGDAQAANQLNLQLAGVVEQGLARGVLERPEVVAPKPISASSIQMTSEGPMVPMQQADGTITMARAPFTPAEKPDVSMESERSEARNFIRANVTNINNSLSEITSAYNKVSSLESQMRKGNRSAINAAIMNTARLISPGVVTDRDAAAFSGANTNVGAMYEFLSGKGVNVEDLIRIYDPANPQVFDPDALLSVARNVTASSIPSLMAQFEDQRAVADQYSLSPQFVSSYLPEDSQLMKSIRDIQQSFGNNLEGGSQSAVRFRSVEEAEQAVQQGRIPIGSNVEVVGPDGSVQSFMVEE